MFMAAFYLVFLYSVLQVLIDLHTQYAKAVAGNIQLSLTKYFKYGKKQAQPLYSHLQRVMKISAFFSSFKNKSVTTSTKQKKPSS